MPDTFLRILSIVMWVPFHTNRNQPNGTRALIIPCADGEVEAREMLGHIVMSGRAGA